MFYTVTNLTLEIINYYILTGTIVKVVKSYSLKLEVLRNLIVVSHAESH